MREVLVKNRSKRCTGIPTAAISLFLASLAFAQDLAPTPSTSVDAVAETERVVVTGTYIPIPTAESEGALPVTTFVNEQLIQFGAQTPAEGLRRLPAFVGTTETENDSNGGTGAARVNLRGYGSENTLTMINGRRAFSFEDINALPLGFIESVEILKDGASATYGADAVAGVVNFKIRHAMKGGELDLLYGNTNLGASNDAAVRTGYVAGGLVGEKYNITAGASGYERDAIFSRDTFLSSLADRRRFGGNNAGSGIYPGRISVQQSFANNGSLPGRPAGSFSNVTGQLVLLAPTETPDNINDYRPFVFDNDALNFREFTPAIPAQERYGFFLDGEYKILSENRLTLFATAIYANTTQFNGTAPAPITFPGFIATPSPYNPIAAIPQIDPVTGLQALDPITGAPVFIQRLNSVSYRGFEIGNRESIYENDFYHYIVGLKGEFAKDYFWELGYVYDENNRVTINRGDQRRSLLGAAVADGSFNPFLGLEAPRQGTLNGFSYDNAAALEAATYEAASKTDTQAQSWDGKVGGRVFTGLPQGGVNFVVGFDLRNEQLSQNADPILLSGDVLGFSPAVAFDTEQDVYAGFIELNIPLVSSTMNIPGVHNLDFTFAHRYERFEIRGADPTDPTIRAEQILKTDVPKFAIRYAPYNDLTLRASYSRSFRAPGVEDFFTPQTTAPFNFDIIDPAAPGGPASVVPEGTYTTGGSLDLQPERTDNYSAGFVFTPRQVPNLTLTADYYQLNSEGIVVSGVAQFIVIQNAVSGLFADRIIRDAGGNLFSVIDTPFNAARKAVEGIDVNVVYEIPTQGFGKFTIALAYNHLLRFNVQTVEGSGFTNFLGQFQFASPLAAGSLPYNKGYLQTEWAYQGLRVINTVNYIGDYKDFGGGLNGSQPVFDESGFSDPANPQFTRTRDVKAYVTLDSQLSYTFTAPKAETEGGPAKNPIAPVRVPAWQRWLDSTTIRVGVNNVFDEPPPFNAGAFNDNYDTSLYSIRGRYYYVGLNKKF